MNETLWKSVGFLGQAFFASRFLVQWLKSEQSRQSVIPLYFWYASLFGGAIMLTYAIHIKDPVFILGQSLGLVVYIRNLVLRRNKRQETPENV